MFSTSRIQFLLYPLTRHIGEITMHIHCLCLPRQSCTLCLVLISFLLPMSQAMDPFLPASVFFFVLCFILVNGGGLSAVLFGAAVVASLALLLHYFSFCFRVDLSQNTNRQRSAALALLLSLVFSSLVSWKIYSSLSRAVALVFFFFSAGLAPACCSSCVFHFFHSAQNLPRRTLVSLSNL